jgi:hypothetical protein
MTPPDTTITLMKTWLNAATTAERELLAQRVGTSSQYLGHIAVNDDRDYKREPKPALAAAIERETKAMSKASKGRLPVVWRTDLVTACRNCEFAKRCLGAAAEASHFPIVVAAQGE